MKKEVRQVRFKEGLTFFFGETWIKNLRYSGVWQGQELFEPYLQTEQGRWSSPYPTDKKSIETAFMELEDMEQILLEEPRFAVSTIQDNPSSGQAFGDGEVLNTDELLALKLFFGWHMSSRISTTTENVRLERLIASLTTWWIYPPARWASSYQRRRLCRVFASEKKMAKFVVRFRKRTPGQGDSPRPRKARPIC